MTASAIPRIEGVDHLHVYVADRPQSEKWYAEVLGYKRLVDFESWATAEGPLTLSNVEGNVHLALFERKDAQPASALAFGVLGREFVRWVDHLKAQEVEIQIRDHDLAISLYFKDIDHNQLEITTYDHSLVRTELDLRASALLD